MQKKLVWIPAVNFAILFTYFINYRQLPSEQKKFISGLLWAFAAAVIITISILPRSGRTNSK
ncbi:MAG: hypothetical protein A2Y17_06315 [Clostridiales bacterium GWF2_38_85]|nr:MAG: hypothetical protein A2Y17_06315 [Clostridiales bacterium GWF2_38_85]HBL85507.1 hypothetical protein [Clostridiales bacterium]